MRWLEQSRPAQPLSKNGAPAIAEGASIMAAMTRPTLTSRVSHRAHPLDILRVGQFRRGAHGLHRERTES
jgi:hypothetical protein